MRFVAFVVTADPPGAAPRMGAQLDDGTVVDLQAARFAMRGSLDPAFADRDSFVAAGPRAAQAAREVVEWVRSQAPPGTTVAPANVRLRGEPLRDDAGRSTGAGSTRP